MAVAINDYDGVCIDAYDKQFKIPGIYLEDLFDAGVSIKTALPWAKAQGLWVDSLSLEEFESTLCRMETPPPPPTDTVIADAIANIFGITLKAALTPSK